MRLFKKKTRPTGEYITDLLSVEGGPNQLAHLNGVTWFDAPIPPRRHHCWPQTEGWINYFTQVWRCACGGICHPTPSRQIWLERNSRKKTS